VIPLIVLVQKDNPDSKESFACGTCRRFYGDQRAEAEACCSPRHCECGTVLERSAGYSACAACRTRHASEKEAEWFEKARKVTPAEYEHEPVHWDGGGHGDFGEGFWSSVEELLEHCESQEIEPPEYVWGCEPTTLTLDGTDIVSRALEDFYENAFDHVSKEDLRQLDEFLVAWCK